MFLHLYEIPSKRTDELQGQINRAVSFVDADLTDLFKTCEKENVNISLVKEDVPSDRFLRAYLKYCNPEKKFCSHALLMDSSTQHFMLTDSVVNVNPSAKELVKIVENSLNFHKFLYPEIEPIHVNLLTNNGHFSLSNETSCKMRLVKSELEEKYPNELWITEWQLDTCLYYESRRDKHIEGSLYVTPDIIVVPNLDTGNAIYKALMKQYKCLGFVLGGTTPAVLNSRSDLDKNEECIKILKEYKLG